MALLRRDSRLLDAIDRACADEDRYVDFAVRWRPVARGPAGEQVIGPAAPDYGYRWDKLTRRIVGPPQTVRRRLVRAEVLPALNQLRDPRGPWCFALWGGRQSGKSEGECDGLQGVQIKHPGRLSVVIGPTYKQTEEIYEKARRRIPDAWIAREWTTAPQQIWLWNGHRTQFLSGEKPQNIRSRTLVAAFLDELRDHQHQTLTNCLGAGFQVGEAFRLWSSSTPTLEKSWVRAYRNRCERDPRRASATLDSRTNPWRQDEVLDRYSEDLGDFLMAQELGGLWQDTGRLVYPTFRHDTHIVEPDGRNDFVRFWREWSKLGAFYTQPRAFLIGHDPGTRVRASEIAVPVWDAFRQSWELRVVREVTSRGSANTPDRHAALLARACMHEGSVSGFVIMDADYADGRTEARALENAGFRVVRVDAKNPPVLARVGAVINVLDEERPGEAPVQRRRRPRLRIAKGCRELINALETQLYGEATDKPLKREHGEAEDVSDPPDALGYLIYWLCPPRVLAPREERQVA